MISLIMFSRIMFYRIELEVNTVRLGQEARVRHLGWFWSITHKYRIM